MPKTIYYNGADIDKIVAVYEPIGDYDTHWVTGQSMTKTNTATGSFVAGVDHRHHKIVADAITEMTAGEKTERPLPASVSGQDFRKEGETTLTASVNDLDVGNVKVALLDDDASDYNVTGLAPLGGNSLEGEGRHLIVCNIGTNAKTFKHEDVASVAGNRLNVEGAADRVLAAGQVMMIQYRVATSRWDVPAAVGLVKLDDAVAPDDNTDLNATTLKHGLLPKLSGNAEDVLLGDGTWGAAP